MNEPYECKAMRTANVRTWYCLGTMQVLKTRLKCDKCGRVAALEPEPKEQSESSSLRVA